MTRTQGSHNKAGHKAGGSWAGAGKKRAQVKGQKLLCDFFNSSKAHSSTTSSPPLTDQTTVAPPLTDQSTAAQATADAVPSATSSTAVQSNEEVPQDPWSRNNSQYDDTGNLGDISAWEDTGDPNNPGTNDNDPISFVQGYIVFWQGFLKTLTIYDLSLVIKQD